MSGRDPQGSSRLSDRPTSEFQAQRQQRQAAEQRRQQLADELGIDEDLVEVRDRQRGTTVRPTEEGQRRVERRIADQSEFLDAEDVETRIGDDGSVDIGPTKSARQRAQRSETDQAVDSLAENIPSRQDLIFAEASPTVTDTAIQFRDALLTGDLGKQADVATVTGGGDSINDIPESPIEAVASADADKAEELLGFDADELREAQTEIEELRGEFKEDPSRFESSALDSTQSVVERANLIQTGLEGGRNARGAARNRAEDIAEEIAADNDSVTSEDVEVRVDPETGSVETAFEGVDDPRQGGFSRDFQRIQAAEQLDRQTEIDVGVNDIEIQEQQARLNNPARQRQIESRREAAAQELDVSSDDLEFDQENQAFELTEEAQESRLEDLENELLGDLDQQTPGIKLDESDVEFTRSDGEIRAELTDDAASELGNGQNAEISRAEPLAGEDFVGQSTADTTFEDPFAEQREGIGIGSTDFLAPGEDFPTSVEELRDVEFGRDEVFTTDLPTSTRGQRQAVAQTSRDIVTAPLPNNFELSDLDPRNIDLNGPAGGAAAVAAGAVAAPEPVSTGTGLIALGALGAGAGAVSVAQQSELGVPQDTQQSELEIGDTDINELEIGDPRQGVSEVSVDDRATFSSELSVPPSTSSSEIDIPAIEAQELVQPEKVESPSIGREEITGGEFIGEDPTGGLFEGEEEFQRRFVERRQEQFDFPARRDNTETVVSRGSGAETSLLEEIAFEPVETDESLPTDPTSRQATDTTLFGIDDSTLFSGVETDQAQTPGIEQQLNVESGVETAQPTESVTATESAVAQETATDTLFPPQEQFAEPTNTFDGSGPQQQGSNARRAPRLRVPDLNQPDDEFDELDFGFDDAVVEFDVDSLGEIDDDLAELFDE